MATHGRQNRYPYVVMWRGAIEPLAGHSGQLSSHSRPELAVKAAEKSRNPIRHLWGAHPPWFRWEVIDSRTGDLIRTIR